MYLAEIVLGPEFWLAVTGVGGFLAKVILDEVRYRRERKDKLDKAQEEANKLKQEADEREEKRKAEIAEREQTRLDLAAVAQLNQDQITQILNGIQNVDTKGENRLKVLLGSAVTTRKVVKEFAKKADIAIETSNGIKADLRENGVMLIPKIDENSV